MILLLDLLSYRLPDKNIGLSSNPIEYFQKYISKTQEELEKTKELVPYYSLLLTHQNASFRSANLSTKW